MRTPPSEGADGAAWKAELEYWHGKLANTIDQACLWAREFHVRTGDGLWGEDTLPSSYPLTGYADSLEQISAALKVLCVNASLEPPVSTWDRTTMLAPPVGWVPGRDPDWRAADCAEGGAYLLMIRPTSTALQIDTAQEQWRTAVQHAAPQDFESDSGTSQIETYAVQAQALFDSAHEIVRAAFRDSVAATYGRIWATMTDSDGAARALVAWLQTLTEWGCSGEECEAVLHDIEVIDPAAVATCRAAGAVWLPNRT
jgi:hypothetical protein